MFSKLNTKITKEAVKDLLHKVDYLLKTHNEIFIDSRQVVPHSIFCAYPGTGSNGCDFIQSAIDKGADTIFWDDPKLHKIAVTNFLIPSLMHYVGILAAHKYAYPSRHFKLIGVTGTNGKTSITHWLNQAYNILGFKTAIIGTTGAGMYDAVEDYAMTTPDPITLQKLLANFLASKAGIVAMEVSSHALAQGRVNGANFLGAIFTNLTQDHLDYHKTMDNYFAAKTELFYWHGLKHVVINADDHYGQLLIKQLNETKGGAELVSYGIEHGDVKAANIQINLTGTKFVLQYGSQKIPVTVNTLGKFNVYNLLAVSSWLLVDGYTLSDIAAVLPKLAPVKGRMQTIKMANRPLVVIDYAHTPDALSNALQTLREVEHSGELYCVLGCGGDRDKSKRSMVGKVAISLADNVIITSDNPRTEDPFDIIRQISAGIPEGAKYKTIENRKEAIKYALTEAQAQDIILIAGKGHEDYQIIGKEKHHFSDYEVAHAVLEGLTQ